MEGSNAVRLSDVPQLSWNSPSVPTDGIAPAMHKSSGCVGMISTLGQRQNVVDGTVGLQDTATNTALVSIALQQLCDFDHFNELGGLSSSPSALILSPLSGVGGEPCLSRKFTGFLVGFAVLLRIFHSLGGVLFHPSSILVPVIFEIPGVMLSFGDGYA